MVNKRQNRGGHRANAGRKEGSYKHGEPTVVKRLPKSMAQKVDQLLEAQRYARVSTEFDAISPAAESASMPLPVAGSKVAAGFPSPAEDFVEGELDINTHLVKHPAATFFLRVSGESMTGVGIFPGDLLVVDRAEQAKHGDVVVAVVGNELTVKTLYRRAGKVRLDAKNPAFPNIDILNNDELVIWGVVRASVRQFRQ